MGGKGAVAIETWGVRVGVRVVLFLFSGAGHSKARCLNQVRSRPCRLKTLSLHRNFHHVKQHNTCFPPHPLRLTVLIRMTKRKMATIDSHTPLWEALAHFNSVLMCRVSIKTLIMWQRRPQGQIASNRPGVMCRRMSSLEASDNVCGLWDGCVWC